MTFLFVHSFHSLTTGPQPLPKRVLHRFRYNASSFSFQYPPFFLRSSSNRLRLLPHLPGTLALPCIFPFITCCKRQFWYQMWPFQLAFFVLNVGYSCPPCLYVIFFVFHAIGPTHLLHPVPAPDLTTFQVFLVYFPKRPVFNTIQNCALIFEFLV
jgi:hypothetical protein